MSGSGRYELLNNYSNVDLNFIFQLFYNWYNQAIQNQRNSFSRGFPLPFNVETLQAFGALFQIPQYYRKFLYYKTKMFM
jgi:hypothetical protein